MRMKIVAPMGGTVWKVIAEEGSQVVVEDVIVILESMKMEIPVVAGEKGTLASILVNEGDFVQENDVIAELT
ncbi:biotin/lipoyl-binding carrier protein [Cytobacillus spongiae]|uniref:biotin/lipoyl-binding carrier protein n=1 Tax=Cytobacillus spongiae TaxID=2901381 RepID=UPI001F45FCA3|nr:biotin/lipoyl-binding carrier protein [Cytobacillus spongiae]UII57907.1 biotin/lipoyl-binding carrier protein [Cytobacillus spongiae]